MEKGMNMSQNSSVRMSFMVALTRGVFGAREDALGGVGGAAGRKMDGMLAMEDCFVYSGRQ